ncbi:MULTISPECIES: hypothetical protein [Delftia]|uniref:hypothetical protein n=1 Tax=Delftia TaxID=80865 RepID=UPI002580A528|nr:MULTISPECIES: hypothetical protein [Delftia]MPT55028.1 hypothetical protein [Delftia sp.]
MENSFQKAYEKITKEDESFDLKFSSKRIQCGGCLFIASLALSLLFWVNASNVFAIVATVIIFFATYNIQNITEKITVKPGEGVIFSGNQLPFADVQKLGIMKAVGGSSAYVIAVSHGEQIKMSGYVGESLAEAIADEIKVSSGKEWI